jgi:hypothetical protein
MSTPTGYKIYLKKNSKICDLVSSQYYKKKRENVDIKSNNGKL